MLPIDHEKNGEAIFESGAILMYLGEKSGKFYDKNERLDLAYRLKTSFEEENIGNAFKTELSKLLTEIKFDEVPSNYSTFYKNNLISKDDIVKKIKYNNKILHQSKILKYFSNESNVFDIT